MTRIPLAKQDFAHWAVTEGAQALTRTRSKRVEDRTLVVNGEPIRFGNQEFAPRAARDNLRRPRLASACSK